jgi:hypothetical protein
MALAIERLRQLRGFPVNRRSNKTRTSQADTATHLTTLVRLARCGLSPTLFWWTNATLVAAAETVHVVREKVVESLNTIARGMSAAGECGASGWRRHVDVAPSGVEHAAT